MNQNKYLARVMDLLSMPINKLTKEYPEQKLDIEAYYIAIKRLSKGTSAESKMIFKMKTLVNHYGGDKQKLQAVEEMAELSKELIKNVNRYRGNKEAIKDELVDCLVMMNQLKIIFNISGDELLERMNFKLDRQLDRIKNESEPK